MGGCHGSGPRVPLQSRCLGNIKAALRKCSTSSKIPKIFYIMVEKESTSSKISKISKISASMSQEQIHLRGNLRNLR